MNFFLGGFGCNIIENTRINQCLTDVAVFKHRGNEFVQCFRKNSFDQFGFSRNFKNSDNEIVESFLFHQLVEIKASEIVQIESVECVEFGQNTDKFDNVVLFGCPIDFAEVQIGSVENFELFQGGNQQFGFFALNQVKRENQFDCLLQFFGIA